MEDDAVKSFEKTKQLLHEVSPSLCLAKWYDTTIHLQNGQTHSCHHPHPHKIPLSELKESSSALHNTKYKSEVRKLMLEGVRPKECSYCWKIEDMAPEGISDRHIKSTSTSTVADMALIASQKESSDAIPRNLEVSFSNICNLKCSYCSPVHSSRWVEEIERHGAYPTYAKFNDMSRLANDGELPIHHNEYNPYVEAFWNWLPTIASDLRVFRITGGEPLLDQNTWKIFDYFLRHPSSEIEISINTNLCVPKTLVDKLIHYTKLLVDSSSIKTMKIYTSIDGWGEQAEYIRFGLSVDDWLENTERVLKSIPSIQVVIMCTSNILSLPSTLQLVYEVCRLKRLYRTKGRELAVILDVNVLRWPGHLSVSILPVEYKKIIDKVITFARDNKASEGNVDGVFYDFEIVKMERLRDVVGLDWGESVSDARYDFYRYVVEHDLRRKTNFLSVFPELVGFFELCKSTPDVIQIEDLLNEE